MNHDLFVTKDGRVFLPDASEKHQYLRNGYMVVKYKSKPYSVHRLVAEQYLPNPEHKSDVNHKDGVKTNNILTNLEWNTRTENLYHALRNGLHDNPEMAVVGIDKRSGKVLNFVSQAEAARITGAKQGNISKCLSGLRRTAGGYYWSIDA